MDSEFLYKLLHFLTASFAVVICYFAISASFIKSSGLRYRSENKPSSPPDGLANGFKIRQGFLVGVSVSNMVRLFCEILTLYLEEIPDVDDQTVDAVYVTSQLLPSQFYALIFSYLAAYFIYLKYSLIGYMCRYLPVLWLGLIIMYYVLLIFSVVLTPDGTVVFKFVAIYDFLTLAALCWYGFGILSFVSTGPHSLQITRVLRRFAPLLYLSCVNLLLAGGYNLTLYLYPPAKNKIISILSIWILELIPSVAMLYILTGGKLFSLHTKPKPIVAHQPLFATQPHYQPLATQDSTSTNNLQMSGTYLSNIHGGGGHSHSHSQQGLHGHQGLGVGSSYLTNGVHGTGMGSKRPSLSNYGAVGAATHTSNTAAASNSMGQTSSNGHSHINISNTNTNNNNGSVELAQQAANAK